MIYPKKWIEQRKQFTSEELIGKAIEVAKWIENYGHKEEDREVWEVVPGEEQEKNALLLSDTGLYGGAAGISLFFLRLYLATKRKSGWNMQKPVSIIRSFLIKGKQILKRIPIF